MSTEHKIPFAWVLAVGACVALSACQKTAAPAAEQQAPSQLGWAREALDRNPNIQVMDVDSASGVFTIRSKTTGEVSAVAVSDLAAAPIAQLTQPVSPPVATAAAPQPSAEPAPEQAPPVEPQAAPAPTPAQTAATAPIPGFDPRYSIERAGGQVKVSGPGVSIVTSGPAATTRTANGGATAATDPIICEGRRLLHLDGRTLNVDGDAIVAREGCELYITNSRIVGSRMGVLIQDAVVHIANSHIEGATASFEADGRAKVYVRNSTFQGLSRRDQLAQVQDQGGNRWH